jgi:hypothetical protein
MNSFTLQESPFLIMLINGNPGDVLRKHASGVNFIHPDSTPASSFKPVRLRQAVSVSSVKVIQDIHVLMGDADNIDPVSTHDVKNQMLPLRKAIITFLYIGPVLAQLRVLRQP